MGNIQKKISSSQIIILGFGGIILLGSLLLMLPFATADGQGAGFMDALFTATSAVCVTGLVVQDTASYWSGFGQIILLLLIQIGGLGIITVAIVIELVSGRKISLKQRSTLQEAISAHQVGGIVNLTGFIVKLTLLFELVGALLMAPVFIQEFGAGKGIWYGLFHSVSAFCNAGFDLMGIREQYSSLTAYASHPMINFVIMALIVSGGLGFMTWEDVKTHRFQVRRYRMQSKVILVTTAALITVPAVYFCIMETASLPVAERILGSVFQSVTTRTAGFNTLDLTLFSETGIAVMIILMIIGGSPGSTAGGMKTTTFAVLSSTAVSVFRKRSHTSFFKRRIEEDTIRDAATILMMYLSLFLAGGFIISTAEQLPLLTCLFETASAIGTVGLTLGITPQLGLLSRVILIILMYLGRVGGLTLIFAALSDRSKKEARYPKAKLMVG